jgi:rsbT co-antagonist protein RsbR
MAELREGREDTRDLLDVMGITVEEVEHRKRYLQFDEADEERLAQLNDLAREYAEPVIEAFYSHLLRFGETSAFFQDHRTLERVKRLQVQYFMRLTEGTYDRQYVGDRLKIGAVHERIGLDVKYYLGSYNFYLREVATRLIGAFAAEPERAMDMYLSLMKLVFLDIGLAIDTYVFQRERTIGQQQEAIRKLSTPVLQVRDRLLILPIIGVIDRQRTRQLTEQLLHAIRANRAKVVVIDITGVPALDSNEANRLIQTVEAARLMGATAIVSGLSAEVAQTLVDLAVGLERVHTVGDLQGGIEMAERMLDQHADRNGRPAESRPRPD